MNALTVAAAVTAVLGSALIGGVFFAFSSFVMKALERVPAPQGIAAMQSINVVVLNPSFLGAFMGTAVLSLGMAALAWTDRGGPAAVWFIAGAVCYLVGTFLVTVFGNVPLNNRLAAVGAAEAGAAAVWAQYLNRWTMLNTVRTVAAMSAALMYLFGLMHYGQPG
jgi:uncharacterized membrane protein